jgi:hypothetical protein
MYGRISYLDRLVEALALASAGLMIRISPSSNIVQLGPKEDPDGGV